MFFLLNETLVLKLMSYYSDKWDLYQSQIESKQAENLRTGINILSNQFLSRKYDLKP